MTRPVAFACVAELLQILRWDGLAVPLRLGLGEQALPLAVAVADVGDVAGSFGGSGAIDEKNQIRFENVPAGRTMVVSTNA
ncbi:MAG: hypothetical protein KatS3mg108_0134 [Isosphaeraceae bacterium]|jgi:hypothetical protein|nr:MAG: hypothetical protein KatS3mg108_0134 [Isosphaeraceae bacterium]